MGIDKVGQIFRISQRPDLSQVPLASPDPVCVDIGESRIAVLAFRQMSYTAVMSRVIPVHVAGQSPAEDSVIEPRVELDLILDRGGLHTYSPKIRLPCPGGPGPGLFEIQIAPLRLSLAVQAGILY